MKKLLIGAALCLTASSVSAEQLYLGTAVGSLNASESGISITSTDFIGLIGYDFNDMFAIEAEASLSVVDDTISGVNVGLTHTGIFAKLTLPTSGGVRPYARIGSITAKITASVSNVSISSSGSATAYGGGLEIPMGSSDLRLDYTAADIKGTAVRSISVGSVFRF